MFYQERFPQGDEIILYYPLIFLKTRVQTCVSGSVHVDRNLFFVVVCLQGCSFIFRNSSLKSVVLKFRFGMSPLALLIGENVKGGIMGALM